MTSFRSPVTVFIMNELSMMLRDLIGQSGNAAPTQPFALIRREDEPEMFLLKGDVRTIEKLADLPVRTDKPAQDLLNERTSQPSVAHSFPQGGLKFAALDSLALIPFRQIQERGFTCHDDNTPLAVLDIREQHIFLVADFIAACEEVVPAAAESVVKTTGEFLSSDDEYAKTVQTIVDDEIGHGEGANFLISRRYQGQVPNWDTAKALQTFYNLLIGERGTYWTHLIFTGERYLVGATPERHVTVQDRQVYMNPISGTFRLNELNEGQEKQQLLDFLNDPKEIYELMMVVDEELKMMCDICSEGGKILGPYLKRMANLIHTEYVLTGSSAMDVRDILRDTMFAATTTGSPLQNACRIIERHETSGRRYYSGALALIGRDSEGNPIVDSPIIIRTADVDLAGNLHASVGATIVRDSKPEHEVEETYSKINGLLTALGNGRPTPPRSHVVDELVNDPEILETFRSRNENLSSFWIQPQASELLIGELPADEAFGEPPAEIPSVLRGKKLLLVEGEDDFVNMFRHIATKLGVEVGIIPYIDWNPELADRYDILMIGPGPGDPRDLSHPKMEVYHEVVSLARQRHIPLFGLCLGHQVICDVLGIELGPKQIVGQGTQTAVEFNGEQELVGYYNTFTGKILTNTPTLVLEGDGNIGNNSVHIQADPLTGEVHSIFGPGFASVQFHAESILSKNGEKIINHLLSHILQT